MRFLMHFNKSIHKIKKRWTILVILALSLFFLFYQSCGQRETARIEIACITEIEVSNFSGTLKFGMEPVRTIRDKGKTEAFRHIFNQLDHSDAITPADVNRAFEKDDYFACMDIRPVFTASGKDEMENGCFLLHLLIGNPGEGSYLIFAGTDLGYALEPEYTDILLECFAR